MLLLTRRPSEQIIVIETGEEIVIAVVPHQKRGTGISIGIEASQRFQIFRRAVGAEASCLDGLFDGTCLTSRGYFVPVSDSKPT